MAKDMMRGHALDFEEIDVSSDREAREALVERSGQMGVPVIDIDGRIIVGFGRTELREALGLR
jgi:glutaredoxin